MRVFCTAQLTHLVTLKIKPPVFSSDLNLLLWMAILGSAGAMLGAVAIAIALGDLLSSLHKRQQHSLLSLLMLLLGILTIVMIRAGKT